MSRLFDAYTDVTFTYVHGNPEYTFPEQWNWHKNVLKATYREFVSNLDIG